MDMKTKACPVYRNEALKAARQLLEEDVSFCAHQYEESPGNQIHRRNYVRAEFAFLDSLLFSFRYMAKIGDQSLLPDKTQAKDNVNDALNGLAQMFGIDPVIKKQSSGWDSMTKAIKLRNRITHPKSPNDLTVSDTDMILFMSAMQWITNAMEELHGGFQKLT